MSKPRKLLILAIHKNLIPRKFLALQYVCTIIITSHLSQGQAASGDLSPLGYTQSVKLFPEAKLFSTGYSCTCHLLFVNSHLWPILKG